MRLGDAYSRGDVDSVNSQDVMSARFSVYHSVYGRLFRLVNRKVRVSVLRLLRDKVWQMLRSKVLLSLRDSVSDTIGVGYEVE